MGNLDVPKVIQASSSSALAMLSLLVLVLAFLAWRLFQRSTDRVKLAVFIGIAAFGLIALGGAILRTGGNQEAAANAAPSPAPTPLPTSTPSSVAAPAPATKPTSTPRDSTGPGVGSDSTVPPPGTAPAGDVTGTWRDVDGALVAFRQDGETVSYDVSEANVRTSSGVGWIRGTALRYRYVRTDGSDQGNCGATLSADANHIDGSCGSGDGSWELHLTRLPRPSPSPSRTWLIPKFTPHLDAKRYPMPIASPSK